MNCPNQLRRCREKLNIIYYVVRSADLGFMIGLDSANQYLLFGVLVGINRNMDDYP